MSNLYFVDLYLWPETDKGLPDMSDGPAANFKGMVDLTGAEGMLDDFDPEEVAVWFAEENARTAAGGAYDCTYGLVTVDEVRPESEGERLMRLGYAPLIPA